MFRLIKIVSARINQAEPVKLPASAAGYTIGEALVMVGGKLTICPASEKPTYISCEEKTLAEDGCLCAYAVSPAQIFECPVQGDASALVLGDKVALTADAAAVNADASGKATICDLAYADKGLVCVTFD